MRIGEQTAWRIRLDAVTPDPGAGTGLRELGAELRALRGDTGARELLERHRDAIVRIDTTTICGTDLHILKGDVPTVVPGRVLGHEGVGIIEEVGGAVSNFRRGDRVIISCIKSCGH